METVERKLSVVIPAYNEEDNVLPAAEAVLAVMDQAGIPADILFVDDGSADGTWERVQAVSAGSERVRGIRFSRNFGKEAAIFAGLEMADGACCAVMDCDLQHPPETLAEMYRLWENGYEVVEGVKEDRGRESLVYKGFSALFYKLMSGAVKLDMRRASDFRLMDRRVVDALVALPERGTFFRALSSWVGYRTATVSFRVRERAAGSSKWSPVSLVRYALKNITSFTTKPLGLVWFMGGLFLLLALVLGIVCLVDYFSHRAVEGFTTVILIELIIGALVMLSLGIIGGYIARIYEEVKGRHRYIVSETLRVPNRRNWN